jgi:uncharacterized membrane protein
MSRIFIPFAVLFASPAFAIDTYQIIDIGTTTTGGTSYATDISDGGTATAYALSAAGAEEGLTVNQGVRSFVTPYAPGLATSLFGIDPTGTWAVGSGSPSAGVTRAIVWSNGTRTEIPTIGGNYSVATDVNANGRAVGVSNNAAGADFGIFWSAATGRRQLPWAVGVTPWRVDKAAEAINASDWIVGSGQFAEGAPTHAALWIPATTTTYAAPVDLGTLGGSISIASDIDSSGQVVGWSTNSLDTALPFLWNGATMSALPLLNGTFGGEALALNDAGQIVGTSYSSAVVSDRATLWEGGVAYDLTDLAQKGHGLQPLVSATGINADGWITGVGLRNGNERGFVAIPLLSDLKLAGARPATTGRNTFLIDDGTTGAAIQLYWSETLGSSPASANLGTCGNTSLQLANAAWIRTANAGTDGVAVLKPLIPASLSGKTVYFQAVQLSDCKVSNLHWVTFE